MKLLLLNFIALGLNVMSFSYNQRYNPFKKANMKPPVESYRQEEKGHLDSKNIKNLEKLFYLRNNKYSPFKNIIYTKYKNNNINPYKFIEDILNSIDKNLSFFPYKYEIYGDFHIYNYKKYLVFYEVNEKTKTVEIILITHSKRYNKYKHLI